MKKKDQARIPMISTEERNVAVAASLHDEQRQVRKTDVWTAWHAVSI